jgi:hypothetical protein
MAAGLVVAGDPGARTTHQGRLPRLACIGPGSLPSDLVQACLSASPSSHHLRLTAASQVRRRMILWGIQAGGLSPLCDCLCRLARQFPGVLLTSGAASARAEEMPLGMECAA